MTRFCIPIIFNFHLSEPGQYLVALHEQLLQTLEKVNIIPEEIHVKKKELCTYLEPLAEHLGIKMRLVKRLHAVENVRRGMTKFLGRKKGA